MAHRRTLKAMSDEGTNFSDRRAAGFILQASPDRPGVRKRQPVKQQWDPCVLVVSGNRLEVFLGRGALVSSRNEGSCCAVDVCMTAAYSPPPEAKLPLDPTKDGATYFSCSGVVAGTKALLYETIVCCALDPERQWTWLIAEAAERIPLVHLDVMRQRDPTAFKGVAARLTHLVGRQDAQSENKSSDLNETSSGGGVEGSGAEKPCRRVNNASSTQSKKRSFGSSFDLEAPVDLFPHYTLLWSVLWLAARALIGSSDVALSVNLLVGFLFAAFVIGRDSHGIGSGSLVDSTKSSSQSTRAINKSKQRRVDKKRNTRDQLEPLKEGVRGTCLKPSIATSDDSDDGADSDDNRTSATGGGSNLVADRAWESFVNCTTIGPLVPFGVGPPLTRPEEFEAAVALNGGNKWSEPPGDLFWCRGQHYLSDKKKMPSLSPLFPLLGLDLWKCVPISEGGPGPMRHIARHPQCYLAKILAMHSTSTDTRSDDGTMRDPIVTHHWPSKTSQTKASLNTTNKVNLESSANLSNDISSKSNNIGGGGSGDGSTPSTSEGLNDNGSANPMPSSSPNEDLHVFIINFLLPWGNFVAYFLRPPKPKSSAKGNGVQQQGKGTPDSSGVAEASASSREASISSGEGEDTTTTTTTTTPTEARAEEEAALRVHALYDSFIEGSDSDRDGVLKIIPRVFDGPWLVRQAVGKGNKAAKLAEHIELTYYRGPNYFEVDVDVSASAVGNRVLGVVRAYVASVAVDLGFVLEGICDEELPERLLGALRFHSLDVVNAPLLPPFAAAEDWGPHGGGRSADDDEAA